MIKIAEPDWLKQNCDGGWNLENLNLSYCKDNELSEEADGDDSEIKHEKSAEIWGSYEDSHRIGHRSDDNERDQRNILNNIKKIPGLLINDI